MADADRKEGSKGRQKKAFEIAEVAVPGRQRLKRLEDESTFIRSSRGQRSEWMYEMVRLTGTKRRMYVAPKPHFVT